MIAYALSPLDLIPDFIPLLGLLDDLVLLPALIWLALKLIPKQARLRAGRRRPASWIMPVSEGYFFYHRDGYCPCVGDMG